MVNIDLETRKRLIDEFSEASDGNQTTIGSYNFVIENTATGETRETQGVLTGDGKWDDMFDWLLQDMEEMDLGEFENLKIVSVEYAGIGEYQLQNEIKYLLDCDHDIVTYDMYIDLMDANNYDRWCEDQEQLKEYLTDMLNKNFCLAIDMIRSDDYEPDDSYWKLDGYGNVITTDSVDFYEELESERLLDDLAEKIVDRDFKVDDDEINELLDLYEEYEAAA